MSIKEYLEEYLNKDENPFSDIEIYHKVITGKGDITVEYNTVSKKADIIHTDSKRYTNYYQAVNAQELKETIEYCLGPVVSDRQWEQATKSELITACEYDEEELS